MALIAQIVLLALAAQAAEPTGTLTLACEGTAQWSSKDKPEPTSMGIIIDFGARTVRGFGYDAKLVIVDITETAITFGGNHNSIYWEEYHGTIDRVTGVMEARREGKDGKTVWSASYSLKCKPTQRMF